MTPVRMDELKFGAGARVLIRVDMNVPLREGEVADDARIRAHLPAIRDALSRGAKVLLMSHLGRPEEGRFDEAFSLAPVARRLGELLGRRVALADCLADGCAPDEELALCENTRFYAGEKANAPELARRIANLCDVFVLDAFGCAHRAHASVVGAAQMADEACAGPLLVAELDALNRVMQNPKRPLLVIVGGAKTETKLEMLGALARLADEMILGGALANTLLAAAGEDIGRSLHDPEYVDALGALADDTEIIRPEDFVCAEALSDDAGAAVRESGEVEPDEMILDFGPRSLARVEEAVARAATILWNGPLGAFEFAPFAHGTETLARAVARSKAYTVAGGGDTLAAVRRFGVAEDLTHVSTGGGAFLEWLRGGDLPSLAALCGRAGRAA